MKIECSFVIRRNKARARFCAVIGTPVLLLLSCGGDGRGQEPSSPVRELQTAPGQNTDGPTAHVAEPASGVGAPPPAGFWEELCNRRLGRADRCGETAGVDSLNECLNDSTERACNELLDARSAAMVIDLLKQAPCRPGRPVLADAPGVILEALVLSGEEKTSQDACIKSMQHCPKDGADRCIAPMLKQPYRARAFECYAHGCDGIRRCTETVLEQGGCP